ncbi:hypothetical protein, partial [Caballeronia calidae]|uniref:hypothetical protein n=1 Tax=Caballeronia calidae TaxID=1777139 RepID=UPI001E634633
LLRGRQSMHEKSKHHFSGQGHRPACGHNDDGHEEHAQRNPADFLVQMAPLKMRIGRKTFNAVHYRWTNGMSTTGAWPRFARRGHILVSGFIGRLMDAGPIRMASHWAAWRCHFLL